MGQRISLVLVIIFLLAPSGVACSTKTTQRDALGTMEVAFEGSYTRAEIKPVLDRALVLYGVELTEENYSRAASSLIVMRKENNVKEMDILDHMIRSHVPGVNITFPEAAAISAVFLAAGDE